MAIGEIWIRRSSCESVPDPVSTDQRSASLIYDQKRWRLPDSRGGLGSHFRCLSGLFAKPADASKSRQSVCPSWIAFSSPVRLPLLYLSAEKRRRSADSGLSSASSKDHFRLLPHCSYRSFLAHSRSSSFGNSIFTRLSAPGLRSGPVRISRAGAFWASVSSSARITRLTLISAQKLLTTDTTHRVTKAQIPIMKFDIDPILHARNLRVEPSPAFWSFVHGQRI